MITTRICWSAASDVYMYKCIHAYMNACVYACTLFTFTYKHTCSHPSIHTCTHKYIHKYIHPYIHKRIHNTHPNIRHVLPSSPHKHQTLNPKQDADDIAAYQITALCMGLVKIKKIGDYQFDMSSDDGVGLYIDDILLLNQTEEVPPLTP